jgi:signal transduction histidine kinase/CheY-like chemotaxis protein
MRRALARITGARLSLKLVAYGALLAAVVVGGAFVALSVAIRASTTRLFTDTQHSLLNLQARDLEQQLRASSVVSESPTLRAAVETYRVEYASGSGRHLELLATIQREVDIIAAGLGKDLFIVTERQGRVLAANERRGKWSAFDMDLSSLPVVRQALDPLQPSDEWIVGVARLRGQYYQVECVPLVLQDLPIGTLILGDRLDTAYVERMRQSFGGEVVVAGVDEIIAATLSDTALTPVALATSGGTVRLAGADFATAALPLGLDGAGRPVTLYLLQPLDRVLGPLKGALRRNFLLYGFLGMLLAGLGAGLVARSLLGPFRAFVRFMDSVAESRDYSRRFDAAGATPEIQTLSSAYDHLVESLAQKLAQLSRANAELAQQFQERERAEQALRSSEEQLRQSQKLEAIGTLAGGVAHDFNNLLTVILSYTDLACETLDGASPVRPDLEQVKHAAERAGLLTKQLLAFSRKQVLQPKVLDLNGVVAGIEKMLRRVIGEDMELRTVMRKPLARVQADPGQLDQVIMNLVVNARDAMPRGGRITIETKEVELAQGDPILQGIMPPGPWVLLAVSDTGVGMDEATRARIFEPFFTTKQPGKGTGLGLSTVYGIVKQSDGFIWVDSTPGHGTTFRIYLRPVVEVDEPAAREGASQHTRRGSETVLLVEDEDPVRRLARRCLERDGYQVLEAAGAEEALRLAAQHPGPIHLLLTDVVMPRIGGRELVERLAPTRAEMQVLYMSGYSEEAVARHGVLDPGTDLLQKPFTPATLSQKVRAVLDRSRQSLDARR